MPSDGELLRRYVETGSEPAFTELVHRHLNVVYRSALRRVGGNGHSADDVAQKVFAQLARKAPTLLNHPSLVGWLYAATRFVAAATVRAEQRRRAYEEKAHRMQTFESFPSDAARFEPVLDDVMDVLPEADRHALLLHFFEGRTFVEVGAALAVTPDAARMRVHRALDRVRAGFARRGIASTSAALGAALATQSVSAAPAGLAGTVVRHALQQGALSVAAAGSAAWAGRLLQFAKVGIPVFAVGVVTAFVVGGFARQGVLSTPPGPTLEPEMATEIGFVDLPARPSVPVAPTPPTVAATSPSLFAQLTPAEQNLLTMLWNARERIRNVPNLHSSLHVGGQGPNASGVDLLIRRGFATRSPRNGNLALTDAGENFCAAARDEIAARPVHANLGAPVWGPATRNARTKSAP